ncbi:MAG: hypothetical protein WCR20_10390 [Verrucomicrobiota bacterium]|jgi:uncharacterized protein YlaI|nr:hypothetical protein [Verrucomicrobiota bacterium]
MKPTETVARRHFLKSGMRYALLAGLTGLAITGEAKRRRLENDPNCIRTYTCADCIEYGHCAKPKAEDFRQEKAQAGVGGVRPVDGAPPNAPNVGSQAA